MLQDKKCAPRTVVVVLPTTTTAAPAEMMLLIVIIPSPIRSRNTVFENRFQLYWESY